ncbi:MAG: hypothetical protein RL641_811 [Candidatus Parcubacteria bacterium]|jgi:hypothetical protein
MKNSFEGNLNSSDKNEDLPEDYPENLLESIGKKPLNLHKYYEDKIAESQDTIMRLRNSSVPNKEALIEIEQAELDVYQQMVEKFEANK